MNQENRDVEERVLGRIRKMLALAADNQASQGERDNAMRMAHATLAKHNLTLAEVESSGKVDKEPRTMGSTETRDQPFARTIALAVAGLYFCAYYYEKRRDGSGKVRHCFVGRAGNVATAKMMTDFVVGSVISEANRLWKQQKDPGPWWTSFCKGAASTITNRCYLLKEEATREAEKPKAAAVMVGEDGEPMAQLAAPTYSTALTLVDVYKAEEQANDEYVEETVGKLYFPKDRTKPVTDGYADGREFGKKVSLNRQVGVADRKRLGG